MNETFKVEPTGRRSKRRWNVWKYRVIGRGMQERTAMGPRRRILSAVPKRRWPFVTGLHQTSLTTDSLRLPGPGLGGLTQRRGGIVSAPLATPSPGLVYLFSGGGARLTRCINSSSRMLMRSVMRTDCAGSACRKSSRSARSSLRISSIRSVDTSQGYHRNSNIKMIMISRRTFLDFQGTRRN